MRSFGLNCLFYFCIDYFYTFPGGANNYRGGATFSGGCKFLSGGAHPPHHPTKSGHVDSLGLGLNRTAEKTGQSWAGVKPDGQQGKSDSLGPGLNWTA